MSAPTAPAALQPARSGFRAGTGNGHTSAPTGDNPKAQDRAAQRAASHELLARMHQLEPGDRLREALREQVIAAYMPYAGHLASRYDPHAQGRADEDLRQVAYLGLIKAVDGFDPDFGTAFLSYATPRILGELRRHFRDHSWAVHVPRRIQELCLNVRPATETLAHRLNREPTTGELAALLGAEPRQVQDALAAGGLHHVTSLDTPVDTGDGTGSTLGDLFGTEDPEVQHVVERETLRPLLAALPERARRILLMSFFHEMTQTQIGAELGVSQMQISRLLAEILTALRQRVNCEATS